MFGYVTADIKGLSKEERATYKAHYCGLCHVLKERYGSIGTSSLSYDMTFLEMLLSDLNDRKETEGSERCSVHPIKEHTYIYTDSTGYAADMQMLLGYYSLLDNIHDEGKGEKEESESVSLIMPDGTEYPPKETDQKLEEIIGLTKNQFMQVAMIAQGEFMELLRAKSDDKKVIFRRLFHTELYQKIVEELAGRRREKQKDIARIRTECQTEAGHIVIPDMSDTEENFTCENAARLEMLKKRIISSDRLSVSDMEQLLGELRRLCDFLKSRTDSISREYDGANKEYLEKRDAYNNALQLIRRFEELEQAEKDLAECADLAEKMKEIGKIIAEIQAAYEIQAVYVRFEDAEKTVWEMKKNLEEQEKQIPGLEASYQKNAENEIHAAELLEQESQSFTRISERVEKALDVLSRIRKAQEQVKKSARALDKAEAENKSASQAVKSLEENEKMWRAQQERLGDAEAQLVRWQAKNDKASEIAGEIAETEKLQSVAEVQRRKAEKAGQIFVRASEA